LGGEVKSKLKKEKTAGEKKSSRLAGSDSHGKVETPVEEKKIRKRKDQNRGGPNHLWRGGGQDPKTEVALQGKGAKGEGCWRLRERREKSQESQNLML